jgi:hypothetical protein
VSANGYPSNVRTVPSTAGEQAGGLTGPHFHVAAETLLDKCDVTATAG